VFISGLNPGLAIRAYPRNPRQKGAFFLVSQPIRQMIVIPPAKNHLLSLAPDDFIARP
jgi:hypothetical protein